MHFIGWPFHSFTHLLFIVVFVRPCTEVGTSVSGSGYIHPLYSLLLFYCFNGIVVHTDFAFTVHLHSPICLPFGWIGVVFLHMLITVLCIFIHRLRHGCTCVHFIRCMAQHIYVICMLRAFTTAVPFSCIRCSFCLVRLTSFIQSYFTLVVTIGCIPFRAAHLIYASIT